MKKAKKKNLRSLRIDTLIDQLSIVVVPSDGQKDLGLIPEQLEALGHQISESLLRAFVHFSANPSNGGDIADLVGNIEGQECRQCLCDCTVIVSVSKPRQKIKQGRRKALRLYSKACRVVWQLEILNVKKKRDENT